LAWLARTAIEAGECRIETGSRVEVRSNFFVEGVWAGNFADGDFDKTETFFGSGGLCRSPNEFVFVATSATTDQIFYKQIGSNFVCSNSLPLLLAELDDELDEFDLDHVILGDSLLDGIDAYRKHVPTRKGGVGRILYASLVVKGGEVSEQPKTYKSKFVSFREYYEFLDGNIRLLLANARDPARSTPLRVLTTQSSGYDSTAVNSIAAKYKIDTALTVAEAKEAGGYFREAKEDRPSDSGSDIARILGMPVAFMDRRGFQQQAEFEHLYWAGHYANIDFNLHQVRDHVGDGAVLLTGLLGASWYTRECMPDDQLSRVNSRLQPADHGCHGMNEVRLHAGYIHAPVIFMGMRAYESVFEISNSEEMRPWSVGRGYDRPIPRRIAEEALVPRHMFGKWKLATVVEYLPPYLPSGAALRREFFAFFRQRRGRMAAAWLACSPRLNASVLRLWRWQRWRRVKHLFSFVPPVRWADRLSQARTVTKPDGLVVPGFGGCWRAVLHGYCVNRLSRWYRSRLATDSG
jgi:hypothetical protein